MKTQSRIRFSVIASIAFSFLIAIVAFGVLWELNAEYKRIETLRDITDKTYGLRVLTASFGEEPIRSEVHQAGDMLLSLDGLLKTLASRDLREQVLIEQLQRSQRELGPLIDQWFISGQARGGVERERRDILASQIWMKIQFISDDSKRLANISESRIIAAQGKTGVIIITLIAVLALGNVTIYTLSVRRIVRTQEELRKSEERYQGLFEDDLTGDFISTPEGQIVLCNPAFARLFGFSSAQEAVGTSMRDLYPDPQELELLVESVKQHRKVEYFEAWRKRRDGTAIHLVENLVGHFDERGELYEIKGYIFDDTNRKRAEEQLRESEQRYRDLVEGAVDGIFVADRDGRYVEVNPAGCAMLGMTREEVLRSTFTDVLVPEEHGRLPETIESFGDGKVHLSEWRFRRRDGSVFVGELAGQQMPDGRLQEIVRDATERKRAERLGLLEGVFREAPSFLHVLRGPDFVFEFANEAYYRLVGSRELIGRPAFEVMPEAAAGGYPERIARVMATREPFFGRELPVTLARLAGAPVEERLIDLVYLPLIEPDGTCARVLGHGTDVTELVQARKRAEEAVRESEERFRRYFELGLIGMAITSPAKGWLEVNDELCAILGYDRSELAQKTWAELTHPDDLAADVAQFNRVLAGEIDSYTLDKRFLHKDGRVVYATLSARCLRHADRSVDYFVVLVQDITERKRAEAALQDLNETLERRVADRTAESERRSAQLRLLAEQLAQAEQKERLRISNILHEHFQQLLVGAQFSLDLVRSYLQDPQPLEVLRQTNEVLSEAIEASRSLAVELAPPMLRLRGLGPTLEWLGQWMHGKYGLYVQVAAEPHVPALASDVQMLLFQAAREVLFNVVKHARVDRAKVELACEPDKQLRLSVSDEGAGFDPARLIGPATSGGFGLLAIRERLSFLDGHVELRSSPGAGTSVSLFLPLTPTVPDKPRSPEVRASTADPLADLDAIAAAAPPVEGRKIRILIADPHETVRSGIAAMLQAELDVEVIGEARDGRQAVQVALRTRPDVAILSTHMPELDGKEATRQILAGQPHVRIIGLGMFDEPKVAEAMKAAGAVDYVTKTSGPDVLINAIRNCAARPAKPSQTP